MSEVIMQSTFQTLAPESFVSDALNKKIEPPRVQDAIQQAWQAMAPFWPLKNLIACNPLQGLEDLPFEQALIEGAVRFQQATLPAPMEAVNRQTIKWC
ncbi:MAG TPA: Na-translocating system protein MpsB, partial [Acidobacteriota bacterium]|nr:Na-translocating system protein MpsB [Acidobacteriota bacterium]